MNTTALNERMNWRTTGIVKGVQVKQIPVEGNACYYPVGSDSYGYQIGKVADDGTSFEVLNADGSLRGKAVLATNKRFTERGYYFFERGDKPGQPSFYRSRGCIHGALSVTQEPGCGKTYWDPSF